KWSLKTCRTVATVKCQRILERAVGRAYLEHVAVADSDLSVFVSGDDAGLRRRGEPPRKANAVGRPCLRLEVPHRTLAARAGSSSLGRCRRTRWTNSGYRIKPRYRTGIAPVSTMHPGSVGEFGRLAERLLPASAVVRRQNYPFGLTDQATPTR